MKIRSAMILLFLMTNQVNGQEISAPDRVIRIDASFYNDLASQWKDIKPYVLLLPFEGKEISFGELTLTQTSDRFHPVAEDKIPLHRSGSNWLSFAIKNERSFPVTLTIHNSGNIVDTYVSTASGFDHFQSGDYVPLSQWNSLLNYPHLYNPYLTTITINPNEQRRFFMRMGFQVYQKSAEVKLATSYFALQDLSDEFISRNLIQSFLQGIFIILLIYNLVIFFITKDPPYLYYSLHIFCLSLWFLISFGLDKMTLLGEYPIIADLIYGASGYGIGAFYILFVQRYVHQDDLQPLVHNLIRYYMYLIVTGIFISSLLGILYFYHRLGDPVTLLYIFPPIGICGLLLSYYIIYRLLYSPNFLSRIVGIISSITLFGATVSIVLSTLSVFNVFAFFYKYGDTNFSISLVLEIIFTLQLVGFSLALGYRSRLQESESARLLEMDKLKSTLFTNISHEFRTPLTLLLGPIQQIESEISDSKHKRLLRLAYTSGRRLYDLINQLLDLSKLEAGSMSLAVSQLEAVSYLKGLVALFEPIAEQRKISLKFISTSPEALLYADRDKFEKIIYNLLSNAIKFTPAQGKILVSLSTHQHVVKIAVSDTGVGIQHDQLKKIFDRFYQLEVVERTDSGTGIGLALVKELVELHQGTIDVTSEPGEGTTFTVSLKLGMQHFRVTDLVSEKISQEYVSDYLYTLENADELESDSPVHDATQILIIEDNKDLHQYLSEFLSQKYNVISAFTGEEGITKAQACIPDLVISDIMMPGKNGYEVCHILKTDERTSHIPVILLTAKSTIAEKLEGLETGADDYLTKPFDVRELMLRIANLIDQRRKLSARFFQSEKFITTEITANNLDRHFLERCLNIVSERLENEQFGIDELALAMGVSRTQLNRKLRALVDQSTNTFIQSCRLNKSKELLEERALNVSEVALRVGFGSTAYFVKCFKDKFGMTPGKLNHGTSPLDEER